MIPAWDPATFFEAPGGAMLVRPVGPCGDEACRAAAWLILRVTWRDREATWTACGPCIVAGRMQTWPDVGRVVEVLGRYDLAAGGPAWLAAPARVRKYELARFVGPASTPIATRPARQALLLETA